MLDWLKDYFDLSTREKNGIAALLILIFLGIIAQWAIPMIYSSPDKKLLKFQDLGIASAGTLTRDSGVSELSSGFELDMPPHDLFYFDPNTVSASDLKKLGLKERQVTTIVHFREKDGRFHTADDLSKIYGIGKDQLTELKPWVKIEADRNDPKQSFSLNRETHENKIIELNTADSSELVTVNGIGPVYASRIIKYRSALGGFISKEQLLEVFGIDSNAYHRIAASVSADPSYIHRVNINRCDYATLNRHPYLHGKISRFILNYREQHGDFKSEDDLLKVYGITPNLIEKVSPYLILK